MAIQSCLSEVEMSLLGRTLLPAMWVRRGPGEAFPRLAQSLGVEGVRLNAVRSRGLLWSCTRGPSGCAGLPTLTWWDDAVGLGSFVSGGRRCFRPAAGAPE